MITVSDRYKYGLWVASITQHQFVSFVFLVEKERGFQSVISLLIVTVSDRDKYGLDADDDHFNRKLWNCRIESSNYYQHNHPLFFFFMMLLFETKGGEGCLILK